MDNKEENREYKKSLWESQPDHSYEAEISHILFLNFYSLILHVVEES